MSDRPEVSGWIEVSDRPEVSDRTEAVAAAAAVAQVSLHRGLTACKPHQALLLLCLQLDPGWVASSWDPGLIGLAYA